MYKVIIKPSVVKAGKKLPEGDREKLFEAISNIVKKPRPYNCKKLRRFERLYRIRVGIYRIIYEIQDDELIILVLKVSHRKDVYRTSK
ncbi:MAG: type II toxin-antitoxin system RelE/ParE family toxin [Candidatus Marinimicrobia bacterium]|nr:type II toxin-antitoxin system RelE/ParE family toxin [Candidatus Neomarinimicrobiota bacterium]